MLLFCFAEHFHAMKCLVFTVSSIQMLEIVSYHNLCPDVVYLRLETHFDSKLMYSREGKKR